MSNAPETKPAVPSDVVQPPPHPVLTSLCRLMGERFAADVVLITDAHHHPLASHHWPLTSDLPPFVALLTADMQVITDTRRDARIEALSEVMGGLPIGFFASSRLSRPDGWTVGYLYMLRTEPRTFERQHYQAFLDSICLASDYLVQKQALDRAARIEAELLSYRSGVETLSDAMLAFDPEGKIIYANRASEQLFGLSTSDLEGQPLTTVLPHGTGALPEATPDAWALGQTEGRKADGTPMPLQVALRPLQTAGGGITLLIRDLSRQEDLQASLRQSQLYAEALIQAMPDTFFVLSKDGFVLGYKAGTLPLDADPVGRSLYQLWPIDTVEQVMLYVRLALMGGTLSRTFALKQPMNGHEQDGQTLEGRVVPMGRERVLLILRNVGHDQRLESVARHYMALMESSADGLALLDHGHNLWYVNPTLARRLGYAAPDELIGSHWSELFPRADQATLLPRIEAQFRQRDHWNGQIEVRRRDGGSLRQEIALAAFEDGNALLVAHAFENLAREGRQPEGNEDLRAARAEQEGGLSQP